MCCGGDVALKSEGIEIGGDGVSAAAGESPLIDE
jgi:hypothetical protein